VKESSRVGIARTQEHGSLAQAVAAAAEAACIAGLVRPGCKVLVKPNLHGGPGFTRLDVVAAVVEWVRSAGAEEIVVGDGPYYGMADATDYFTEIGLRALCDDLSVPLVCFHEDSYDVMRPALPSLPPAIGITRWFAWADVVINLPVMKTHFNTLTTLAIKNLKGFLRPQDKRDLHRLDLHLAIAALATVVRPQLHILDATTAYEGMGPNAATPVEMGLLLASADAFALDVVANWLMGFDPATVRYLREGERLGLGAIPSTDEAIAGLTNLPQELFSLRRRLRRPYETAAVEYPGLRISTELACSGCLMNLFTALAQIREEGCSVASGHVAIGRVADDEVPDLAVGLCTFSAWDRCPSVSGCPPTIEAMKQALRTLGCKGSG